MENTQKPQPGSSVDKREVPLLRRTIGQIMNRDRRQGQRCGKGTLGMTCQEKNSIMSKAKPWGQSEGGGGEHIKKKRTLIVKNANVGW